MFNHHQWCHPVLRILPPAALKILLLCHQGHDILECFLVLQFLPSSSLSVHLVFVDCQLMLFCSSSSCVIVHLFYFLLCAWIVFFCFIRAFTASSTIRLAFCIINMFPCKSPPNPAPLLTPCFIRMYSISFLLVAQVP